MKLVVLRVGTYRSRIPRGKLAGARWCCKVQRGGLLHTHAATSLYSFYRNKLTDYDEVSLARYHARLSIPLISLRINSTV